MNAAAFQGISSELARVSSSHERSYRSQLVALDQVHNCLHLLQDKLEIGPFRPSNSPGRLATPAHRQSRNTRDIMTAAVFWSSHALLPIGTLSAQIIKKRRLTRSPASDGQELEQTVISLTFVPPRWLSNTMLKCQMDFWHSLKSSCSLPTVSLTPLTVNYDPLLSHVIKEWDVAGLQSLFGSGLARPTDCIPYKNGIAVSLMEVGHSLATSEKLTDLAEQRYWRSMRRYWPADADKGPLLLKQTDMYRFLLEQCGPAECVSHMQFNLQSYP